MIPIAKPHIKDEEINAVINVLKSGILIQGPKVREFEERFGEYIGTEYGIATNSGTSALHTALLASGIGTGDEVITTPFSFIASSNSILYTGAKPVFADINEHDFNINPEMIEEKITHKTKAVLIVHLYGQSCDMGKIMQIAEKHNLILLEDSCQAHGAEYYNKKVGSFGTGCFSFYPTKNMITGEGGMITTNDRKVADKARMIRDHGSNKQYYHEIIGYNYRMTDIAAAIGLEQLKKLDKLNQKRIENADYLTEKLNHIKGIITPKTLPNRKHIFHQYTIRVTRDFSLSRDDFVEKLGENEIGVRVYYPLPIHKQELYKNLGYNDNLPVAEKIVNEVVSLPVHPGIEKHDIDKIAETINSV